MAKYILKAVKLGDVVTVQAGWQDNPDLTDIQRDRVTRILGQYIVLQRLI